MPVHVPSMPPHDMFVHRLQYSGPGGSSSRWSTPTAPGKPVEVQRAQVDVLFKNLRGGEELEETEPRAPIFCVAQYCLSDRVLLPPISTSEESADLSSRKRTGD
jgi:hypothetical protein